MRLGTPSSFRSESSRLPGFQREAPVLGVVAVATGVVGHSAGARQAEGEEPGLAED